MDRPIRPNPSGKYNLDFIDWNNEWERVAEVQNKIENGEEVSDKEEEERVRRHMEIEERRFGTSVDKYKVVGKCAIPFNKECYICLNLLKNTKKVRQLPCKHMFCEACLRPWLEKNTVCPVCKFELVEEKEEEEDEEFY